MSVHGTHVYLDQMNDVIAADIIAGWIQRHDIQVLNVAGSRGSKDPRIHDVVVGAMETVLEG